MIIGRVRHLLAIAILATAFGGCSTIPPSRNVENGERAGNTPSFDAIYKAVTGNAPPAADAYEQVLTAFKMHPDLGCQQPTLYAHLATRHRDLPVLACPKSVVFQRTATRSPPQLVEITPRRVRAIHLLYAGEANHLTARFGHVALRLIVCPQPDSSDTACAENVQEHLVLGFRAQVDDLSLSLFKGLTGGYSSSLFAHPFLDTYEEYAIGEFRELFSLPLKMNTDQREEMVRSLAEIHWRFRGGYRFFSENCATQLQDAMRATWTSQEALDSLAETFIRPDRLFRHLKNSPVGDGQVFTDLARAESDGYYFSSTRNYYDAALAEIAATLGHEELKSLDFFLQVPPEQRRYWEHDPDFNAALGTRHRLRDALLVLEEYSVLQQRRQLTRLAREMLSTFGLETLNEFPEQLKFQAGNSGANECLASAWRDGLTQKRSLLGIPLDAEQIADFSRTSPACDLTAMQEFESFLITALRTDNPVIAEEIIRTKNYLRESLANVATLRKIAHPSN